MPDSREEAFFEEAAAIRSAEERANFIEASSRGNPSLREKLELLLEGHFGGEGFLTEIPPASFAPTPCRIGERYTLLEQIGEGSFGEVWLAEQRLPLKRRVAVKVLKLGMDSKQVLARFEVERQALAMMDHPNIARIFDGGFTDEGRPFFAMELVQGSKITEYCKTHGLRVRERLELFIPVCQAVQHAHQKGVIHRDLKPSNVLIIEQDGKAVPKVIDFGIAKAMGQELTEQTALTGFLQLMGNPAYISPEQALMASKDIDTRSDIYSLGILLYELLAGRPPFDSQELLTAGVDEMRRIIATKEPPRPRTMLARMVRATGNSLQPADLRQYNADLDWIVMKCLEKDVSCRYQTANGLAMDLRRYLENEPVLARPPSKVYRFSKVLKRNPTTAGLSFLLLIAIVTALGLVSIFSLRLTRANAQTEKVNRTLSRTLVSLQSEKMEQRAADGLRTQPMAWLSARLRADPNDRSAAARLVSMLSERSYPLLLLPPLRHGAKVSAAAFSVDGTEIMTGSEDGKVRFWNPETGQLRHVLEQPGSVAHAAYAAKGQRLLVCGHDRIARIYSAQGSPLFQVPEMRLPSAVHESPDGRKLYVEHEKTISQWDSLTGKALETTIQFPRAIRASDYSGRGNCVAVLTEENTVETRDLSSGLPRVPPRQFSNPVDHICFSNDGERLFISYGGPRLDVYEFVTGALTRLALESGAMAGPMLITPDDRRMLVWTWGTPFCLIDLSTGKMIMHAVHNGPNASGIQSNDGTLAATAGQNGASRVIDFTSGIELLDPIQLDGPVSAACFSPDNTRLLTGCNDGTARLWDIRMRRAVRPELPPSSGGGAASFSHSGLQVVTSVEANGVQVHNVATAAPIGPILHHPVGNPPVGIRAALFSSDDRKILTVGYRDLLRVWNAATYQPEVDLSLKRDINSGKFSPDGQFVLAADRNGFVTVWTSTTGKQVAEIQHDRSEVLDFTVEETGARLLTASLDGTARLWSFPQGEPLLLLKHKGIVWSAQFSPDGSRIVTASSDGTAQEWDSATGEKLLRPFRHANEVFSAVFSPNGRFVATSSADGTARIWEAQSGTPVTPLLTHKDGIWQAAFTPDSRTLVTGSQDFTVRFWDVETGLPMSEPLLHDGQLGTVSVSPNGRHLLTFGGRPRLWDIVSPQTPVPEWFCELAEAVAGVRQTKDDLLIAADPQTIPNLRQRLRADGSNDFYARWARWFLFDRMQASVRPFRPE